MVDLKLLSQYSADMRLLYVEDNEEARISTLFFLENFFENIEVAVDGQEGLEKFKSTKDNPFDLIITDINMPKMSGIEMMERIRDINKTIPMIVFSAFDQESYIQNSVKLSVAGYLLKPIDEQQFGKALAKVVFHILQTRLKKEFDKVINV